MSMQFETNDRRMLTLISDVHFYRLKMNHQIQVEVKMCASNRSRRTNKSIW